MRSHAMLCAILLCTIGTATFAKDTDPSKAKIVFHFTHTVDGRTLQLADSLHPYQNAAGDDFFITTFKYYISNVILTKTNGEAVYIPDSYFLVNAADSSTFSQELTGIPKGKYNTISFTIGVDSSRNFEGAQTGCLDPAKGMFWSWKTGYIYVKFEGKSSQSTARNNRLTFHIGGAIAPTNTIRTVTQSLPSVIKIKKHNTVDLDLTVNAAAMFKGNMTVRFADLNSTMGGPKSVIVADNYANGLFQVTGVHK